MQRLRGRDPPRPSHGVKHGVVEVIPGDRASSISVIAISRSSRYGGLNRLIPVDVLLIGPSEMLAVGKRDIRVVR
jgi:hypothetical protein